MLCVNIYVLRITSGFAHSTQKKSQKRAKHILLNAQKILKSLQKNICVKITLILSKKYGHYVETLQWS